jgi:hypothetical protein
VKDIGDKKVERFHHYRNGPLSKWSALSKEKSLNVAAIEMQCPPLAKCRRYRNGAPKEKSFLNVAAIEMQCPPLAKCRRYRNGAPKEKSLKVTTIKMQCLLEMKRLQVKATAIEMEHPLRRK